MRREPGWIARADREGVELTGVAVLADGREIPVEITNLTPEGCRVRSDETIGIGERIHLMVPSLEDLAGTIRWSLAGDAGVRFTRGEG